MKIRWNLTLVLAVFVLVIGAALAIAGSSSNRLVRKPKVKQRGLASANYVDGVQKHRFRITAQTLRKWLSGPTPPLVVDVRHAAPHKVGHIPGAVLRSTKPLLSGKVKLKAKGRQVVIYDQDGRLTPYLIHPIRAQGIDAYILAGGYAAWMSPSASRQAARRRARTKGKGGHAKPSGKPATTPTPAPTPDPASAAPPPAAAPPPMGAPPSGAAAGSTTDAPPADEGC
jgi:rhodanese-related sulfurtransferase